jgi:hypothetical protein
MHSQFVCDKRPNKPVILIKTSNKNSKLAFAIFCACAPRLIAGVHAGYM